MDTEYMMYCILRSRGSWFCAGPSQRHLRERGTTIDKGDNYKLMTIPLSISLSFFPFQSSKATTVAQ